MPHRRTAAWLHAALVGVLVTGAVCAPARAAFAFEVVPRLVEPRRPHAAAYACALAGAGLIGASFPLADDADRRYRTYEREADPTRIAGRWDATVRADRLASGALLTGEALLATAVWLRFLQRPGEHHVALEVAPARCAVSCSF
jgi:heme A synthase